MDLRCASFALALVATAVAAPGVSGQSARDEAFAREAMAVRHFQRGELAEALEQWRTALSLHRRLGNARGQAAALSGIAMVAGAAGEADSAFAYFRAALPLARSAGFDTATSSILGGLATVYATVGQLDSAIAYHQLSVSVADRARHEDNAAAGLLSIGAVYSEMGRTDSALFYARRALARFERSPGQWASHGRARTYNGIGGMYYLAGEADSAAVYFARALELRRALLDRVGEANTLGNLAALHESAGRLDTAAALLEQALPLHQRIGNKSGEAWALRRLGMLSVGRRESGDTTANFAGGILFLARALELAREASDSGEIALSLQALATAWRRVGIPERAVAYYDSAAAAYSRLRRHLGSDANAVSFGEEEQFAYWPWALALLQMDDPIRAWAVAERGRAQAVVDLMSPRARRLAGQRADAGAAPPTNLEGEAVGHWQGLRDDSAYVLFYLQAGDTLALWLMTPQGELPFSLAAVRHDTLASLIAALRVGIGADAARRGMARGREQEQSARGLDLLAADNAAETLRQLSEVLLPADVLSYVPSGAELVIVPHGALGLVPFAALQLQGDSVPLGIRHPLRYAPSLRALVAASARAMPAPDGQAVVVGNPLMPDVVSANGDRVRLSDLPGAAAEADDIAGRLGVAPWRGSDASEDRVRRSLPAARLVHLATHGLAFGSESRVRQSYVALAPAAGHDGLLTLGEIMDDDSITLVADLVVLSACQTGLGELKQAEGTIGLQRALLAKGARSVLVSLWSVDDEATRAMMQTFYEHWLAGASKAEALRRAQASIRGRPEWANAQYWAAFQLVGAR